jgi:hypothetical protein
MELQSPPQVTPEPVAQPTTQAPATSPVSSEPPKAGMTPQPAEGLPTVPQRVPFYRLYWIFAAIYLLTPFVLGLVILLTGGVYRKDKSGQALPIKKREKITLTVASLLLWGFTTLSLINGHHATMQAWYSKNGSTFNSYITTIQDDSNKVGQATSNNQLKTYCQTVKQDAQTAKTLPAMPDKLANGYYQDLLLNTDKLASACIDGVNNPSAQANSEATIRQATTQGESDQANLAARFKADSLPQN